MSFPSSSSLLSTLGAGRLDTTGKKEEAKNDIKYSIIIT
jgi:hypothetical protein